MTQLRRLFGRALEMTGDLEQSSEQYRVAVEQEPTSMDLQCCYRDSLLKLNREDEAFAAWKHLREIDTKRFDQRDGYFEFCLYLGKTEEYRTLRDDLLNRFADSTDRHVCERIGRACLLTPGSEEERRKATAMIDRAMSEENSNPTGYIAYFSVAKALADFRANDFAAAIDILKGNPMNKLGPSPRLIRAMAEFNLGNKDLSAV